MKKIICLILAILTTFAFAGCSCSGSDSSVDVGGSFWLKESLFLDVPENFYESATYSVKIKKSSGSDIDLTIENGTYSYEFKSVSIGETTPKLYYQLDTTLVIKGAYKYNNQTYPVDDLVFSSVIFSGANEVLKPIASTKKIKTTTPVLNGKGNTSFENYDFSYTVDYTADDGDDAVITYTDNKGNSKLPANKTIDDFFSTSFCENELLTLYPRMFEREEDFDLSLDVLNPVNQTEETINVSTRSFETPYTWNGNDLLVDCLAFTKSGTYSGIPIIAYYTSNFGKELANGQRVNQRNLKHRLIKMETGIADVGTLVYELTNFTNNSI